MDTVIAVAFALMKTITITRFFTAAIGPRLDAADEATSDLFKECST